MERGGQQIAGSIDLVWQTDKESIVIDYKTNPMSPEKLLDPSSLHYVGLYAGQLDAYTDALMQAGCTAQYRYIYYPVNGLLAEIGPSIDMGSIETDCAGEFTNLLTDME